MVRCRARCLGVIAVAAVSTLLSACRVDVTVAVDMAADGSGMLTVTLAADAEVVEQASGIAEDLRFDDLVAAGWEVGAPVATDAGGLQVALRHAFADPDELTALVASLNGADGPFKAVVFSRHEEAGEERTHVRYTVTGTGRVDAGLASFADADLVAAVGATPYADDVATAGLSQSEAVVITLRVELPGEVEQTTATEVDGALTWVIPLDSRPVALNAVSTVSTPRGGSWSIIADVLRVVFIGWLVLAGLLLAYLPVARHRRVPIPSTRYAGVQEEWDDPGDPAERDDGPGERPPKRPTFPSRNV